MTGIGRGECPVLLIFHYNPKQSDTLFKSKKPLLYLNTHNYNHMPDIKLRIKDILFKLQKRLHIDTLYLARGGFWISSSFILTSILSLVQVVIFANFLPKESYGVYKYILSLASIFSFLTLTGMNEAVTQAAARSGSTGILKHAVKTQLKWNFLFTIVMTGLAGYYFLNQNILFAKSLFVLGLAFPLNTTFNTYGAFLVGRKDFRRASIYGTITPAVQLIALAIGALITQDIFTLVIIYAIASFLPNLIFCLQTIKLYGPESISQKEEGELILYSKHLSFMHILSSIAQYVDKLVIFHYIGAIQLAVYSLALAIPERARGFIKNLSMMMTPKLSEKTVKDIHKSFYKRIFQGMLIGAVMSAGYILLAPFFYRIFLPAYLEAIAYSQIFSLTLIFVLPSNYLGNIFNAHKMLRPMYFSSLTASILKILLYIVLGKLFGIWGVIASLLIVYIVNTIYNCYLWEMEVRRQSI